MSFVALPFARVEVFCSLTSEFNVVCKIREMLQRSGDDFVTMKHLFSGIYHYRFIVNGVWTHDELLPCTEDDVGRVCNILDVRVLTLTFYHFTSVFFSF